MPDINLWTFSVLLLYIASVLFPVSSPSVVPVVKYVTSFVGISIWGYLEVFFLSLLLLIYFCFCFSFWLSVSEVSIIISSNSAILSLAIPKLLVKPQKTFFISVIMFLCLAFLFSSFLEFPSSYLHYPSVPECCLLFPLNVLGY